MTTFLLLAGYIYGVYRFLILKDTHQGEHKQISFNFTDLSDQNIILYLILFSKFVKHVSYSYIILLYHGRFKKMKTTEVMFIPLRIRVTHTQCV